MELKTNRSKTESLNEGQLILVINLEFNTQVLKDAESEYIWLPLKFQEKIILKIFDVAISEEV